MEQSSVRTAPCGNLRTNRGWFKLVLLNIVTFGVYGIVFYSKLVNDVNRIATPRDGKKTMHYCLMLFVFTPLTLGIVNIVWSHRLCRRIGVELRRRGIGYDFGPRTFWGWNLLGAFLFVGPFIFQHRLCKAMNLLCADYNARG